MASLCGRQYTLTHETTCPQRVLWSLSVVSKHSRVPSMYFHIILKWFW